MKPTILVVGLLPILAACGKPPSSPASRSPIAIAPPDPWSVTTLDPNDPTPALLWNGVIGIRLGRDGTGNGLPFFAKGSYEAEGEEQIRELPNPLEFSGFLGGVKLDPKIGIKYEQKLNFKTGVLHTAWSQMLPQGEVNIEVGTTLHPDSPAIAQTWSVRAPSKMQAKLTFPIPKGNNWPDWNVSSSGVGRTFTYLPSGRLCSFNISLHGSWKGSWKNAQAVTEWNGKIPGNETVRIRRTVCFKNRYIRRELNGRTGLILAYPPEPDEYDDNRILFPAAMKGWTKLSDTDINIDGPVEDQQAIRSHLFYLRSAHDSEWSNQSVAPMGLSNARYNGHVFWDADIWVFPVMALLDPERARGIPQYRLDRADQAIRNYREWINADRPIGDRKLGSLANADLRANGMMFPWESSVSGKETQPGEPKYQHHVSGSVAFALAQAAALGLAEYRAVRHVIKGVADFYRLRIVRKDDGTFVLNGVYPPDESTFVDNDLYTNLVAQWCINGGTFSKTNSDIKLKLPKDEQTFLTYDGDRVISYKQAAAVLSIYPLQYPETEKQAKAMMERFEPKVPSNGPAMSDSIHALIWARLGEREKAYKEWRESWEEFTNHPLLLFSEKRVESETYFVTGAAGCLQTVIFGFLGFRIDDKPQPGAAWSIPLKNGKVLSIKPNLPPAWKKVTFRKFSVLGKRYTLEATHDKVAVTQIR